MYEPLRTLCDCRQCTRGCDGCEYDITALGYLADRVTAVSADRLKYCYPIRKNIEASYFVAVPTKVPGERSSDDR